MKSLDEIEELLSVKTGPFKGKPQQWFTRKDVMRIVESALSFEHDPVGYVAIGKNSKEAQIICFDILTATQNSVNAEVHPVYLKSRSITQPEQPVSQPAIAKEL